MNAINPWLLVTKYRIGRCCKHCSEWTVKECGTGKLVYPYRWKTWAQALDEVRRRQARQYAQRALSTSPPGIPRGPVPAAPLLPARGIVPGSPAWWSTTTNPGAS